MKHPVEFTVYDVTVYRNVLHVYNEKVVESFLKFRLICLVTHLYLF